MCKRVTLIHGGRVFEVKGTVSAKALKQEGVHVLGVGEVREKKSREAGRGQLMPGLGGPQ